MDIKRTVLWIIFVVSLLMLFDNWQRFQGRPSFFFPAPEQTSPASQVTNGAQSLPAPSSNQSAQTVVPGSPGALDAPQQTSSSKTGQKIRVTTDLFVADIDTVGGVLSYLELKKINDAAQKNGHVVLFNTAPEQTYLARTGLVGEGALDTYPNHNSLFTVLPGVRDMGQSDTLQISLESKTDAGVKLIKRYTFKRGSYVIDVTHQVINAGAKPIQPTLYLELVRHRDENSGSGFYHTFTGPAVYTDKFQKVSFDDIEKGKADYPTEAKAGWIAMIQHYFVSSWIPATGVSREIYFNKIDKGFYRVGVKEPLAAIAPGAQTNVQSRLFVGPQEERLLESTAPGLELVKDYGIFTVLAKPLFWILEKLYGLVGNWGWAIIGVTFILKLVFFPLSATSYKSMARMKELTPRMQALRERHKNDTQAMNKALMTLYRTEKVNPFNGCFPILIQIPVFIALYWVLISSVEMRGAPWLGWIHDLSVQDPYYILPILMAVSMLVQTKLNPTPPDPMQAKLMMFMPIAFSFMFLFLPSGLVLYYVVNNVLSILQQWSINRMMGQPKAKAA